MTDYKCPKCNQLCEKPPWLVAREKGFDDAKHCTLMANNLGKIIPCVGAGTAIKEKGFVRIVNNFECESCKIYKHFVLVKVDKFGRETVIFDETKRRRKGDENS